MPKIKVLLADDHTIVRKGLRLLLELENDLEVIGEAAEGREALKKVEELCPDVVVLDIAMPGMNGLEAARQLMKKLPKLKVIILSVFSTEEYVLQALQAGVAGYLIKSANPSDLITAIRCVFQGESYLSPSISRTVIEEYLRQIQKMSKKKTGFLHLLSTREREILQLIAEGHTNKEIASFLCVSTKTIETHKDHLKKKLNIKHTIELFQYAVRMGFVIKEK
jgi:two-component system, NarL family, response regulator NreC